MSKKHKRKGLTFDKSGNVDYRPQHDQIQTYGISVRCRDKDHYVNLLSEGVCNSCNRVFLGKQPT